MVFLDRAALAQERASVGNITSVPAPIGGLNTRDSESLMEATDALTLDNLFPQVGSIKSRKGSEEFTTAFPSNVETLTSLNAGGTTIALSASGEKIYTWDHTTAGTPTEIGTGFTNARWQDVNMGDSVLLFNGVDTPQRYNGSTLSSLAIVLKDGGGSVIVGTTAEDMDGCNVFKNRLYIWSTSEQRFFVGGVDAIQGDFTEFPLSFVSNSGGALIAMGTITRDGGAGADDIAAFIMSTGKVFLYNGSNPNDASNWSLEGVYKIPPPISVRAVTQFKGDLKIITEADQISLLEVVNSGGLNLRPSKLSGAIRDAVILYGSNYGWEAELFPSGDMLIFNVPLSTNNNYQQYVINTVTGAACRFTNLQARTFAVIDGSLFFGESTRIMKADTGFTDDGANIDIIGERAFVNFGSASNKTFKSSKEIMRSAASLNIAQGRAIDFGVASVGSPQTSLATGVQWDVPQWDTAQWADDSFAQNIRFALRGVGVAISTKLSGSVSGDQVEWFRTDFIFKLSKKF